MTKGAPLSSNPENRPVPENLKISNPYKYGRCLTGCHSHASAGGYFNVNPTQIQDE